MKRRDLLRFGTSAVTLPFVTPLAFAQRPLAQADADPLLAEILRQFQRVNAGLASTPPKGSAQQMAALFRMLAAWSKTVDLDGQLRAAVEGAVDLEGHTVIITKLGTFDYRADVKQRGIQLPPNFPALTPVHVAKAIGYVRAGFSVSRQYLAMAAHIERHAARFDRQMLIRNGYWTPDIRLIQDPADEIQVTGTCTQNADGTFTCNLVASGTGGTQPAWCNDYEYLAVIIGVMYALYCLINVWFCILGALSEAAWASYLWYVGCD